MSISLIAALMCVIAGSLQVSGGHYVYGTVLYTLALADLYVFFRTR